MTTPPPQNHEILTPEIAKLKPEGMKCRFKSREFNDDWILWCELIITRKEIHLDHEVPDETDVQNLDFIAPLGTTAALSTPLPEARCECAFGDDPSTQREDDHENDCPAHPRNRMVLVLPGFLAGLPEKPDGLMWAHCGRNNWTECELAFPCTNNRFEGGQYCCAYALPQWSYDAAISTQPEEVKTCAESALSTTSSAVNVSNKIHSASNAAPETSEPFRAAATESKGESNWADRFAGLILVCLKYPRGSEAQIRCLEEVGDDAKYYLKILRLTIAPGHNPNKLTVSQVGEGWRLLDEDEIFRRSRCYYEIECLQRPSGNWLKYMRGGGHNCHYRTRLSRAELAKLEAPEWKLPEPPAGKEWHRSDFTESDLPPVTDGGLPWRPLLMGETPTTEDEWDNSNQNLWRKRAYNLVPLLPTNDWLKHRTRRPLPSSPTFVPWDFESAPIDTKIRQKCDGAVGVAKLFADGMSIYWNMDDDCEDHSFESMLSGFTLLDGTPCGKEVK